jgi:MFS family permease
MKLVSGGCNGCESFPQIANHDVGCLIGAVFILNVGDYLGRRKAMILGPGIMIIGVIIQVTCVKGHAATAQFIIGYVGSSQLG